MAEQINKSKFCASIQITMLCNSHIMSIVEDCVPIRRLLQKSTVSQSCEQDCLDFAERMKRKALRVRSEGSIPPYVTEAESPKQHSDSPLCNSLPLTRSVRHSTPLDDSRYVQSRPGLQGRWR